MQALYAQMKEDIKNNPAVIFPEIVGVLVTALATPYYLFGLYEKGYILVAGAGCLIWGLGVYYTIGLMRKKLYILAWFPMLLILGAGYLTHVYLVK